MRKGKLRLIAGFALAMLTVETAAQGWPSNYGGVMLQGFFWESFEESKWTTLEAQADELSQYFDLVWIPQSAECGEQSMGYDPIYWFPGHYNSSFGTETELRSMISTFKQKGIGTIADVVLNHHKSMSNLVDFPEETYNGVSYQLKSTDICKNDDGGATYTWATQNGYTLSANNDTGEDYLGLRDLDPKSTNVKNLIKAYLKMLIEDMGYTGFRYDMPKGYAGKFIKDYNDDSNPQFSIGDYNDVYFSDMNWVTSTSKRSAVFDYAFRNNLSEAIQARNWQKLNNNSVASSSEYCRYAVTFIENHNTQRSEAGYGIPIKKDTLAANAYMLASPGTPCVFLRHWIDYKPEIKAMIDLRKAAGINNQSQTVTMANDKDYFARKIQGTQGSILVVVGPKANKYEASDNNVRVLAGKNYFYYLNKGTNTAWVDKSSGDFIDEFDATLTIVNDKSDTKLVYTTDGSEPSATNGTQASSGATVHINTGQNVTLKVGLLNGTTVSGIVTRIYKYVNNESSGNARRMLKVGTDGDVDFVTGQTWASFYTKTEDLDLPANLAAYIVIAVDDKSATLKAIKYVPKGVAVLLKRIDDLTGAKETQYTESFDGNKLKYADTPVTTTGNEYVLYMNMFIKATGTIYGKCYLELPAASAARQLAIEVATSIDNGKMTIDNEAGAIYDLQGRKVSDGQLKKGVYIQNGQKILK